MTTVESATATTRTGAVGLTVAAAALSVVLIGLALVAHGVGAPPVVWLVLTAGALAIRPVAVAIHRRRRHAGLYRHAGL